MKKISVIITSYNQKSLLKQAIHSVINQTFSPFEIIICDDASTDGSQEMIRDYEQKYPGLIKGILHEKNLGISKNRNSGMKSAKGDFVTWLDGDDLFRPRKLELELEQLHADPEVKWVYSQVIEIDVENNIISGRYRDFWRGKIFDEVVSQLGCAPRNPLVALRTLRNVGFFDEEMELYEDFDLCLRLARYYKCSYCCEPLMEYRIHTGGTHNAKLPKHIVNFRKLHNNLLELLKDETEKMKGILERKFLQSPGVLFTLIRNDIDEGKRLNALINLLKGLISNSLKVSSLRTYAVLMRIILSAGVGGKSKRYWGAYDA